MSWYYSYYLGMRDNETGVIEPLGIYDSNRKIHSIVEVSRSFASDMHEMFYQLNSLNCLSKKFREDLDLMDDDIDNSGLYISYLPYDELPKGDFIRKGYFLTDAINEYEKEHDEDILYDFLTPNEYLRKYEKEQKFGKKEDEYHCEDYSYYAYPKYISKEYESFLIRQAKEMLIYDYEVPDDKEIVVLLWQG